VLGQGLFDHQPLLAHHRGPEDFGALSQAIEEVVKEHGWHRVETAATYRAPEAEVKKNPWVDQLFRDP
jgi:hypothetical protein